MSNGMLQGKGGYSKKRKFEVPAKFLKDCVLLWWCDGESMGYGFSWRIVIVILVLVIGKMPH